MSLAYYLPRNEQNYNNVCFQQEKGATLGESLPL